MALQLAFSFGHIHLDKFGSRFDAVIVAEIKAPASTPWPTQHPANDADDYCAICATIHLASSSFVPDAPQLPSPFVLRSVEHFHHVAFIFVAAQGIAFQARAPPLA
jgi:hypothetical protein